MAPTDGGLDWRVVLRSSLARVLVVFMWSLLRRFNPRKRGRLVHRMTGDLSSEAPPTVVP